MKITKSQLQELIKEAFQDGFFDEVTEEILNDEEVIGATFLLSDTELNKLSLENQLFMK